MMKYKYYTLIHTHTLIISLRHSLQVHNGQAGSGSVIEVILGYSTSRVKGDLMFDFRNDLQKSPPTETLNTPLR